jgi:hypothetical protein
MIRTLRCPMDSLCPASDSRRRRAGPCRLAWRPCRAKAAEAAPDDPAQPPYALNRQSQAGLLVFFGVRAAGACPVNACTIHCPSIRCKHLFKKPASEARWPVWRSTSAMRLSPLRALPLPGRALSGASGTATAPAAKRRNWPPTPVPLRGAERPAATGAPRQA